MCPRGLPGPDDREAVGRLGKVDERVRRDQRDAGLDPERGNVARRNVRLHVGRVDDPAPHLDRRDGAVEEGDGDVPAAVVMHAEEAHTARRHQPLVQDARVVVADLVGARAFVKAGVRPVLVDAVVSERPRLDAVVGRWLMQTDERICVEPVPSGSVTAVDEDDLGVAVSDKVSANAIPDAPAPTTR